MTDVDYEVTAFGSYPKDSRRTDMVVWAGQNLDFSIDRVAIWFAPGELDALGGIEGLEALGIPTADEIARARKD
jgi:hypothetical protein